MYGFYSEEQQQRKKLVHMYESLDHPGRVVIVTQVSDTTTMPNLFPDTKCVGRVGEFIRNVDVTDECREQRAKEFVLIVNSGCRELSEEFTTFQGFVGNSRIRSEKQRITL